MTQIKKTRKCYWEKYCEMEDSSLEFGENPGNNYQYISLKQNSKRSDYRIEAWLNITRKDIDPSLIAEDSYAIALMIEDEEHGKNIFDALKQEMNVLKKELGDDLFHIGCGETPYYKFIQVGGPYSLNESDWATQHEWLNEKVKAFNKTFDSRISKVLGK